MNNRDQVGLIRRSSKAAGTANGIVEAWGACWKNSSMWLQEIVSAKELSLPRMWTAQIEILCQAVIKNKLRSNCIIWGSLLYPKFTTLITASLSQCAITLWLNQCLPQITHPIIISKSSLHAINSSLQFLGHLSWNQSPFHHAPQPNEPETSENMWWLDVQELSIIFTPFHCSKKQNHFRRSDWSSGWRRIILYAFLYRFFPRTSCHYKLSCIINWHIGQLAHVSGDSVVHTMFLWRRINLHAPGCFFGTTDPDFWKVHWVQRTYHSAFLTFLLTTSMCS